MLPSYYYRRFAALTKALCRILIGLGLVPVLSIFASSAHATITPLADYTCSIYQMENGLPQNFVKKILQTRDGYTWAATQEGLARFDGTSFTSFTTANSSGLVSNNIHDIEEDGSGDLWIWANSGLSRYHGGVFENITPQIDHGDRVIKIVIDSFGRLTVGCDNHVYRWENGRLRMLFNTFDAFQESGLYQMACSSDGSICVGDRNRLLQYLDGTIHVFRLRSEVTPLICADGQGSIWIAQGATIKVLRNGALGVPHGLSPVMDGIIQLEVDRNNTLWIASGSGMFTLSKRGYARFKAWKHQTNGLVADAKGNVWIAAAAQPILGRFRQGKWSEVSLPYTIATERVVPVLQDAEGDIWVGTYGGLLCYRQTQCVTVKSGLPPDKFTAICQDRQGAIWLGTLASGLWRRSAGEARFVRVGLPDGPSPNIKSLCLDSDGNLWVGTIDKLLILRSGQLRDALPSSCPAAMRNQQITAICQDVEGRMWVAVGTDVVCIDHSATRIYTAKDGIVPGDYIRCIYPDHRGGVWISGWMGVAYVYQGKVKYYGEPDGLPTVPVIAIYEDSHGDVWFGLWGNGLYRFRNGTFRGVDVTGGLYADSIHQILGDGSDNLLIGSSRGIFRINLADVNSRLDGNRKTITCDPISADQGAAAGGTCAGTQPTAWKCENGDCWFACVAGIVQIKPAAAVTASCDQRYVPPMMIETATVDGYRLTDRRATAPPGPGRFEAVYGALSYHSPELVRYRYILDGLDPDWTADVTRHTAYYTNIPPGTYTFRVQAYNDVEMWRSPVASFKFTIRPHYYQTVWFQVLRAVAGVILIVLVFLWRTRAVIAQNRKLEGLVGERTEELTVANKKLSQMHEEVRWQNEELQMVQAEVEAQNDELICVRDELELQNEALVEAKEQLEGLATTDGLTGLKNHRAFQEFLEQQWERSKRNLAPISLIMMDVDSFKVFNDTYGHPAGDHVLKVVGQILMSTARSSDFVARYGGEEFAVVLPETDAENALIVAERIRAAIESAPWELRPITGSFGVATSSDNSTNRASFVADADSALYHSKRSGRNRVTHSGNIGELKAA